MYNIGNFFIILINLYFFKIIIYFKYLFYHNCKFFYNFKNDLNSKLIKYSFLKLFNKISKVFAFTSSISVILSVLFWRVFIFYNFSKEISGILFSSFAIGSFIGTIFSTSIAPSIIKKKIEYKFYLNIYLILSLILCIFVFIVFDNFKNINLILYKNKSLFLYCSLFSVLGSAIMLFSIIKRIHFYNLKKI